MILLERKFLRSFLIWLHHQLIQELFQVTISNQLSSLLTKSDLWLKEKMMNAVCQVNNFSRFAHNTYKNTLTMRAYLNGISTMNRL